MTSTPAYSSFTALLIFFAAVAVMDIDQTVTVHRKKLALMRQYARTVELQKQAEAQTKWAAGLRHDLLALAPGDPEAEAVVSELGLRADPGRQPPPAP